MHLMSPAVDQSADQSEETVVLDTFAKYVSAWRDADIHALSQIYANDQNLTAVWPDPGFSYPLIGWSAVSNSLADVFRRCRGMDLEYSNHIVKISGTTAVLTANWKWLDLVKPRKPEAAVPGNMARSFLLKGVGTFVFERRGPDWVLTHEHSAGVASARP